MLQGMALSGLESLINRALSLDPRAAAKLGGLQGCHFALHLQDPDLALAIGISGQRLQLLDAHALDSATTRLSGRWSEFAAIAVADDPGAALINGQVQLQGDTAPLLELRNILADLDMDWEQPLAETFGDVVGHQLGRSLRSGQHWLKGSNRQLQRQAEEFLLEESRLLPHPLEVKEFCDDLDELRSRSERLEARLRRLQQRLAAANQK